MDAKLHLSTDWPDAILDERWHEYLSHLSSKQSIDVDALRKRESSSEELSVWQYVQLIKAARDYPSAYKFYIRMNARGVAPNKHIFATLIDKTNDFDLAVNLLEEAKSRVIDIDEAIYNAVMSHARTLIEAKKVFEIGKVQRGFVTTYPFNTLISKFDSLTEAIALIREMWRNGPLPDQVTISAALNIPWETPYSEFATAARLVSDALDLNSALRQSDIAALLRRAISNEDVALGLALLERAGLSRTINIDNAIISVSPTFSEAMRVYHGAIERGARPDRHTVYALLRRSSNYAEAFETLAEMRTAGLSFGKTALRLLIAKMPRGKRSRALQQQIESTGETNPEEVVRGIVIICSADHERKYWLDRIFPRVG